ncbi:MAG: efflux RND transporter permease subunit [Candidatus Riflebacteria bacterium]|nr:efflux RND transporter permease subunit [Candidatus Riflebacteria bacterium]
MIETFIRFCMRNRLIVFVAALLMTAIGIRVAYLTPVDAIPDLSENQVVVFADWMGRSPKEIEDQITFPLSVNLQGLAGIKAVRSSSEFNFSMINVIFDDSIDFYFARQRILERLSTTNTFLPAGVIPYMAPDATALGQIFWYTLEGRNIDFDRLRAIQDWYVRYQLNSVPGVAQVATVGGSAREYQIDIDPNKLRAFSLSLGEVSSAVARSNSSVGGRVIHKGNAEYLIRSVGWIKSIRDIENTFISEKNGVPIYVKNVATVQLGPEFKRSFLEKDGNEAVGGVVMMRFGENPLEVIQRVKEKIRSLQSGLPDGVTIVPFYDRTALINRAIHTLTGTLTEELIVTCLVVLLIMGHFGCSIAVCIALPMAVLVSIILMKVFGISSNIMSLSGIAISIGIIVDQSIVMVENAAHNLHIKFGDQPVSGDTTEFLIPVCQSVGRPIFFSVMIMILSFLPVFALGGMEGKMFHPLAFTKVFALLGVSIISISLVPALLPLLIRGRLRKEEDSWIVRQVIEIYRPVLRLLMDRTKLVIWFFILILAFGWLFSGRLGREFMPALDEGASLEMPITVPRASVTEAGDDIRVRDALLRSVPEVEIVVGKSGRADTPTDPSPLDMIETIINFQPQEYWTKRQISKQDAQKQVFKAISTAQQMGILAASFSTELKEKLADEITMDGLPRFDEAMRGLCIQRQYEFAPILGRRLLSHTQEYLIKHARRIGAWVNNESLGYSEVPKGLETFILPLANGIRLEEADKMIRAFRDYFVTHEIIASQTDFRLPEITYFTTLNEILNVVTGKQSEDLSQSLFKEISEKRKVELENRTRLINEELFHYAAEAWTSIVVSELSKKGNEKGILIKEIASDASDGFTKQLVSSFKSQVFLWKKNKPDLIREMDQMLTIPGWGNIWTQPIINRIDMLSTGVRTMIGVKVFGSDITEIQTVSEKIAAVLRLLPGAADVFADQNVGKGYIEIRPDRLKAAKYGISIEDIQNTVEVALGGKVITTTVEGRERFPVRIRYARDFREDEEKIRRLLISGSGGMTAPTAGSDSSGMKANTGTPLNSGSGAKILQIPLSTVAEIAVVEGPAMIKSENGMLRSYVQLNVRDRDIVGFVEEAQREIGAKISLPQGMYLEWSGQFEHQIRARRTLSLVFPLVALTIFIILYITYHDLADSLLMMMAVPGAVAGGVMFQYFFGYNFSVAVWVGYIACFGMAAETGIIMLVYLRMALDERGGLGKITSLDDLKDTILKGAVHRLRPKLLTEGTAILGLAPMLWATGTGAEIMRPMAAPVLGGILIADEVIDLFLPVLFYWIRKRRWLELKGKQGKD